MKNKELKPGDIISFNENETIAVKAVADPVDSAETLVRFAASNLKTSSMELFKTIKKIKPELKEWAFAFNNQDKTVVLRYKE